MKMWEKFKCFACHWRNLYLNFHPTTANNVLLKLPMIGFDFGSYAVSSNQYANCSTITAIDCLDWLLGSMPIENGDLLFLKNYHLHQIFNIFQSIALF